MHQNDGATVLEWSFQLGGSSMVVTESDTKLLRYGKSGVRVTQVSSGTFFTRRSTGLH
jgi:hypothetical protein